MQAKTCAAGIGRMVKRLDTRGPLPIVFLAPSLRRVRNKLIFYLEHAAERGYSKKSVFKHLSHDERERFNRVVGLIRATDITILGAALMRSF